MEDTFLKVYDRTHDLPNFQILAEPEAFPRYSSLGHHLGRYYSQRKPNVIQATNAVNSEISKKNQPPLPLGNDYFQGDTSYFNVTQQRTTTPYERYEGDINEELCEDVLITIFSFLPKNDLLQLGLVCKGWYLHSKNDILWELYFVKFRAEYEEDRWQREYVNSNQVNENPDMLTLVYLMEENKYFYEFPSTVQKNFFQEFLACKKFEEERHEKKSLKKARRRRTIFKKFRKFFVFSNPFIVFVLGFTAMAWVVLTFGFPRLTEIEDSTKIEKETVHFMGEYGFIVLIFSLFIFIALPWWILFLLFYTLDTCANNTKSSLKYFCSRKVGQDEPNSYTESVDMLKTRFRSLHSTYELLLGFGIIPLIFMCIFLYSTFGQYLGGFYGVFSILIPYVLLDFFSPFIFYQFFFIRQRVGFRAFRIAYIINQRLSTFTSIAHVILLIIVFMLGLIVQKKVTSFWGVLALSIPMWIISCIGFPWVVYIFYRKVLIPLIPTKNIRVTHFGDYVYDERKNYWNIISKIITVVIFCIVVGVLVVSPFIMAAFLSGKLEGSVFGILSVSPILISFIGVLVVGAREFGWNQMTKGFYDWDDFFGFEPSISSPRLLRRFIQRGGIR